MSEINAPQPPSPPAGFRPPQSQSDEAISNPGRSVIRIPRAVAILMLTLLIIGVAVSVYLFAGNLSRISPSYFFGCLLSFFAGGFALFFAIVVNKKKAIGAWTQALATVVESELVWGTISKGGRTAWTWLARFTYQYEVGGQVYRSQRIAFYRSCTGSCAQELIARHPSGSQVVVYYDPAQPAEAVMDRSFRALWILPFFAIVFAVLAIIFFRLPALLAR